MRYADAVMMKKESLVAGAALAVLLTSLCPGLLGQRPVIMLTGYWPPSNEAVRPFSTNPAQNPAGWIGSDWEGLGYDIHSFFPEFSPPNCSFCGIGSGDLTVDYQDTTQDFFAIADSLQPIAIITLSRGFPDDSWEVEMNQFNRSVWIDDYQAPLQPTPAPPDPSVPAGFLRPSMLPVQGIVNAVLMSGAAVTPGICATADGGGFLSEYVAYLGVWYQAMHSWPGDPAWCNAAGHIHVGGNVSWPAAQQATEVTLRELIAHVDSIRATTVCQQDLGFAGPGTAELTACGGALNYPGNVAEMRVSGALPNGVGLLVLGAQNTPTPMFGGTAIPLPAFFADAIAFDANGDWSAAALLEAPPMPMPDVFAQVAWFDPALPQSVGISNALRIVLQ